MFVRLMVKTDSSDDDFICTKYWPRMFHFVPHILSAPSSPNLPNSYLPSSLIYNSSCHLTVSQNLLVCTVSSGNLMAFWFFRFFLCALLLTQILKGVCWPSSNCMVVIWLKTSDILARLSFVRSSLV